MFKQSSNPISGLLGNLAVVAVAFALTAPAAMAASAKHDSKGTFTVYNLDIVGPVQTAGSDKASVAFNNDVLPGVSSLLSGKLSERTKVDDSAYLLDPSKLSLKTSADVRVYFIGEEAGYANSLGFNTEGSGVNSGNPLLIFPNASSAISTEDFIAKAYRSGADAGGSASAIAAKEAGKADPKGNAYGLYKSDEATQSLDKLRSESTPCSRVTSSTSVPTRAARSSISSSSPTAPTAARTSSPPTSP